PAGPGASPQQAAVPAPSPAASTDAGDEDSRLYAVAHQAHFVARDPDVALRAWDAYLAAYPSGRFALEARFNRALTLVRLGRLDEARTALTPFASGEAGGYRQREARELLDAMQ
ncbi:MAG: tetratricopeptide repeat protein, partial [Polyangiaceae bacterium]